MPNGQTVSPGLRYRLTSALVPCTAVLALLVAATPCFAGSPCTITCPANLTPSAGSSCSAIVTYPAPMTTGPCGTITCSPASGATYPLGQTTVKCVASGAPNSSCTFTITVADTTPPTITCPPDQRRQGSGPVIYPPPTVSDNCPGLNSSCAPPSGAVFPIGNSTAVCMADDASGNTATCAFGIDIPSPAGAPALGATALAVAIALLGVIGAFAARRLPVRQRR